ncbi:hypothetical protein D3C78_1209780 [compost metagenome]
MQHAIGVDLGPAIPAQLVGQSLQGGAILDTPDHFAQPATATDRTAIGARLVGDDHLHLGTVDGTEGLHLRVGRLDSRQPPVAGEAQGFGKVLDRELDALDASKAKTIIRCHVYLPVYSFSIRPDPVTMQLCGPDNSPNSYAGRTSES